MGWVRWSLFFPIFSSTFQCAPHQICNPAIPMDLLQIHPVSELKENKIQPDPYKWISNN